MASATRRSAALGLTALALSACAKGAPMTASHTPRLQMKRLTADAAALARRATPGRLAAGLINLESGENWSFDGERRFPMLGLAAAPIAAAALAEADAGRLKLGEMLTVTDEDLSPPPSAIAQAWPGRRAYTAGELVQATVALGDATARDVLMKRIGGPGAVTAWLDGRKIEEVRIDRYWRELVPDLLGLASFRAAWRGQMFAQAAATLPVPFRAAAVARFMADPRDMATPRGLMNLLSQLDRGDLLAPASRRRLLDMMTARRLTEGLAEGLPGRGRYARVTSGPPPAPGTAPVAAEAGIFTLKDGRRYAAAAFLTGPEPAQGTHTSILAGLGRSLAAGTG